MKRYSYVVPVEGTDDHRVIVVTEQEIIHQQHSLAMRCGFVYADDEAALSDFICVHWAVAVDDVAKPA
jgi:hypothetical protein